MDPVLFRVDWEVLSEVLALIIVLSFFVERALSIVFEHRLFVNKLNEKGVKEPIAFLTSFAVVWYWKFDALSVVLNADKTSLLGYLITAAIISGGSKASIKLFHDVINAKSSALKAKLKV
jgi:hypothetical protein